MLASVALPTGIPKVLYEIKMKGETNNDYYSFLFIHHILAKVLPHCRG